MEHEAHYQSKVYKESCLVTRIQFQFLFRPFFQNAKLQKEVLLYGTSFLVNTSLLSFYRMNTLSSHKLLNFLYFTENIFG